MFFTEIFKEFASLIIVLFAIKTKQFFSLVEGSCEVLTEEAGLIAQLNKGGKFVPKTHIGQHISAFKT